MIYTMIDESDRIIGAVDTKRIVSFVYDGTSPDRDPRYILKLDWGHTLQVGSVDMQHILQMAIDALGSDNNVGSKDGDMISRKAAIDAVFKLCDETDNPHVDAIVYELESLPSAQPKPLTDAEVVICKLYLDDLDKYKTCNEYKLLMGLLDGTASAQPEPCEDCVSRKAVIRLLHSGYHSKSMIEEVKELPSVQPKHRTGNWIPVTYRYVVKEGEFPKTKIEWQDATEPDDVEGMKCSECGTIYDFTEARNWCSECGADMRGEQDE